ncbi:MAG: paraquat-inducible protein A [Alphaproteobacteria bacterium]|nr:paraquat-inducible protein A [Alphaproteobacteria bacterium]MCB9928085.1 paraquat-inducible protein A [Alphaproteobacteria bacterium]
MTRTLGRSASGADRLVGPALLVCLPLLVAGLVLPSLHFQNLWVLSQDYSLWGAAWTFWNKGHYSLFAVLFAFTVVLPLAKVGLGLWVFYGADIASLPAKRWLHPLAAIAKWSMLDVFIVAVVILALEGSLLTAANLGLGIALFAAAVVLSGWAYGRLARLAVTVSTADESSPHA